MPTIFAALVADTQDQIDNFIADNNLAVGYLAAPDESDYMDGRWVTLVRMRGTYAQRDTWLGILRQEGNVEVHAYCSDDFGTIEEDDDLQIGNPSEYLCVEQSVSLWDSVSPNEHLRLENYIDDSGMSPRDAQEIIEAIDNGDPVDMKHVAATLTEVCNLVTYLREKISRYEGGMTR